MPRNLFVNIMSYARKLNIPIYFYGDVQSFRLGAKSKALPTKQIIENIKNRKEKYPKISPLDFTKESGERMIDSPFRVSPSGHSAAQNARRLMYFVDFIHHFEKYVSQKNYKVPSNILNNKQRNYIDGDKLKQEIQSIIINRSEFSERLFDKLEGLKKQRGIKSWCALSQYLDDLNQIARQKDNFKDFLKNLKNAQFVKSYFGKFGEVDQEDLNKEIETRKDYIKKEAKEFTRKYKLKVEV